MNIKKTKVHVPYATESTETPTVSFLLIDLFLHTLYFLFFLNQNRQYFMLKLNAKTFDKHLYSDQLPKCNTYVEILCNIAGRTIHSIVVMSYFCARFSIIHRILPSVQYWYCQENSGRQSGGRPVISPVRKEMQDTSYKLCFCCELRKWNSGECCGIRVFCVTLEGYASIIFKK